MRLLAPHRIKNKVEEEDAIEKKIKNSVNNNNDNTQKYLLLSKIPCKLFFLSFFVSGFCFFAFLFCGFRQRLSELSHLSELEEEEEDCGSDWEDDDDLAKR